MFFRKNAVLAAAAVGVLLGAQMACAAWPDKPIRFIVPYPPGGGTDIVAHAVGKRLSDSLGQPVIVENRPGASTIIGTDAVARAEGDGYTIGLVTDSHVLNPLFYPKRQPYDARKDFAPVGQLVSVPFILVANPKTGWTDVSQMIEAARARPGKITYASIGNGTPHYLAMELTRALAGVDMVHVPYKGVAPALADLLGGQVDVMFIGMSTGLPQVRNGRLTALAVSGSKRSPIAPDIPTVARESYRDALEAEDADLAIGFLPALSAGFYQQRLFGDHYVCLMRAGHPRIGQRLGIEQFAAESHVMIEPAGSRYRRASPQSSTTTLIEQYLEKQGLRRHIALRVPHFTVVPEIIGTSDLLAVLPSTVARIMAPQRRIKILPLPLENPPCFEVKQFWHERNHQDEGTRWLRGVIAELFMEQR